MANSENKKDNKPGFFKTVKAEWKKIIWPSRESVLKQSVAVTAVAVVVGILITIFDFFIQYGINFITGINL
ncbi:MAG: preprotein translocase subunit SecE [Lachnospiraceae bacterium]|nr:preprotein translocase subunit SecE [Lachnospiraceae bacterium]